MAQKSFFFDCVYRIISIYNYMNAVILIPWINGDETKCHIHVCIFQVLCVVRFQFKVLCVRLVLGHLLGTFRKIISHLEKNWERLEVSEFIFCQERVSRAWISNPSKSMSKMNFLNSIVFGSYFFFYAPYSPASKCAVFAWSWATSYVLADKLNHV